MTRNEKPRRTGLPLDLVPDMVRLGLQLEETAMERVCRRRVQEIP